MVVPLFAIVLFAPLVSDDGLVNFFRRSIPLFDRVGHIDSVLVPKETKKVRELFEQAGVKPEEPINTLGIELLGWIPFDDANGNPVLRSRASRFSPAPTRLDLLPAGFASASDQEILRALCCPVSGQWLAADSPGWLLQIDGKVPRHQSSLRTNIHKRVRPSGVDGATSEAQVPRARTNNREAPTLQAKTANRHNFTCEKQRVANGT